jgi:hypothetical protein
LPRIRAHAGLPRGCPRAAYLSLSRPSAAPQPPLSRPSRSWSLRYAPPPSRCRLPCAPRHLSIPVRLGARPTGGAPSDSSKKSLRGAKQDFHCLPFSLTAISLCSASVQLHRLSLSLSASPQPQQAPAHSHHASEASRSKGAMAGGEGGWRSDVAGGALLDRRGAGALHGRTSASPSSNMLSPSLERVCVWESQCYMVELSKREKLSLDDGAARSAKWRWQW